MSNAFKYHIPGMTMVKKDASLIKPGDFLSDGPGFTTEVAKVIRVEGSTVDLKILYSNWPDAARSEAGRPAEGDVITLTLKGDVYVIDNF